MSDFMHNGSLGVRSRQKSLDKPARRNMNPISPRKSIDKTDRIFEINSLSKSRSVSTNVITNSYKSPARGRTPSLKT